MNDQTKTLREEDLEHFTGTENWCRHPTYKQFFYTDGVQYLAEQGGAYWLIDKIFFAQFENRNLPKQPFQTWVLELLENGGAKLSCHDGNYNWQHKEQITFTDFPLKKVTLYFIDNVLLLTSEY